MTQQQTQGLTPAQRTTLEEIATGHVTTVNYASGPSYWGPTRVFRMDDVHVLLEAGLIYGHETGGLALTPAGRAFHYDDNTPARHA